MYREVTRHLLRIYVYLVKKKKKEYYIARIVVTNIIWISRLIKSN